MSKINGVETEWTLLQRKIGNLPEKEEEAPEEIPDAPSKHDQWASLNYNKLQNQMEKQALNDDDELYMQQLKQKRLQEMKQKAELDKYGSVQTIQANEYISEVSQSSVTVAVVVHLYSEKEECKVLDKLLSEVAAKHKYVKFVRIKGCLAIPNFPDRNCPTLVVYNNGENKGQIVGLSQFGGINKVTTLAVELALARMGIFKSIDFEEMLQKMESSSKSKINYKKKSYRDDSDEEDDD